MGVRRMNDKLERQERKHWPPSNPQTSVLNTPPLQKPSPNDMRMIWGSGSANQHRNEVKIEMKQASPYHVDPSEYTDELMEEETM